MFIEILGVLKLHNDEDVFWLAIVILYLWHDIIGQLKIFNVKINILQKQVLQKNLVGNGELVGRGVCCISTRNCV